MNTYGYVEQNPNRFIDPTGEIIPIVIGITARVVMMTARVGVPAREITARTLPLVVGDIANDIDSDDEICEDGDCPPCNPYPVGTVGYQGPEVHHRGYDAGTSHYHLFVVEQIPSNCDCIWKEKTKTLAGNHHYYDQPNIFYTVNQNGSGRPPNYPH